MCVFIVSLYYSIYWHWSSALLKYLRHGCNPLLVSMGSRLCLSVAECIWFARAVKEDLIWNLDIIISSRLYIKGVTLIRSRLWKGCNLSLAATNACNRDGSQDAATGPILHEHGGGHSPRLSSNYGGGRGKGGWGGGGGGRGSPRSACHHPLSVTQFMGLPPRFLKCLA